MVFKQDSVKQVTVAVGEEAPPPVNPFGKVEHIETDKTEVKKGETLKLTGVVTNTGDAGIIYNILTLVKPGGGEAFPGGTATKTDTIASGGAMGFNHTFTIPLNYAYDTITAACIGGHEG